MVGEWESENVLRAGLMFGDPVHGGAEYQSPDLQDPRLGVRQRFHPACGVAYLFLGQLVGRATG